MIAALAFALATSFICIGAVRLYRAVRMLRTARLDSAYRAASLVIETKRTLRAGQHRANENEWGRAA